MKTVIITGISKGIGRALATKFIGEGYDIIGTTRDGKYDIDKTGITILGLELSDPQSISRCANLVKSLDKKIDILVNNAGALFDDEETVLNIDKLRQTLEVNLIGTADFTEQIIPAMNEKSHIVFISSQAGSLQEMDHISDSHSPYHYPAYKISKCALNMYARTLAARFDKDKQDLTVSAVHPGWVRTDMGGDEAPTLPEEAAENIYNFAISRPVSGKFWFNGREFPW